MSVQIQVGGALEEPTSVLLTSTSATDIKTLASGDAGITTIVGVTIVNQDSSARLVSVWWTNNATDYLIYQGSVPANSTVINAIDIPLMFNAKTTARKIRAQAAAANVVTVTVNSTLASQNLKPSGN